MAKIRKDPEAGKNPEKLGKSGTSGSYVSDANRLIAHRERKREM